MDRVSKSALFDLDGVLIDAKDWHYEALNRSLEHHGYRGIPYPEHLARFDGIPTRVKLAKLCDEKQMKAVDQGSVESHKQDLFLEIVEARCVVDDRLQGELALLRSNGIRLGVCTNSIRRTLDLVLSKLGLASFFDLTLSNQDIAHPKPHPEIYEVAMRRLGTLPGSTAIIEDSKVGIAAAAASGAHVVIVKGPAEVSARAVLQVLGLP